VALDLPDHLGRPNFLPYVPLMLRRQSPNGIPLFGTLKITEATLPKRSEGQINKNFLK
jgi:hypothetical protein